MVTGFFPKQKAYIEKEIGTGILKTSDRDFEKEELWHKQMLDGGFKYNEEYNFYFSKDGALMDDTNATLAEYFSNERHLECITNGYEVAVGEASPLGKMCGLKNGIYCKNYLEVIENLEREKETGMQK